MKSLVKFRCARPQAIINRKRESQKLCVARCAEVRPCQTCTLKDRLDSSD